MNTIMGMTNLLLEENLTPEQRDFVETIKSSGEALIAILSDILDLSKITQEKIQLEDQTFEILNCIEEAQEIVASKAAKKKINLAYTIEEGAPKIIIGDPNRLRQILVHLLNNAIDLTERGEVLISVSTGSSSKSSNLHFAIEDTGTGMPQESADRLFETYGQVIDRLYESFSQADFESIISVDGNILNKGAESSIGLAISKRLVELMGGKIWAKSRVGEGTTVHFTIRAEQASIKSAYSGIQPQLDGKRILIADGSRTNSRILDLQTGEWGMVPTTADSSNEALGLIQNNGTFDVAILDINMPDMDGYSLAKQIGKYDKSMPLVALAGIGQQIKPGVFAYSLSKPLKFSELHNILVSLFEEQPVSTKDEPSTKAETNKSSLNVLLAEDNLLNQKVFLTMLRRLGHNVDAVTNGIEALQAIERGHYDIVLMDIKMPRMNGLEATKIIRQRWHDGPVIVAVTAFALEGDREKFLAAGMNDYISKTIKIHELKAILERFRPD